MRKDEYIASALSKISNKKAKRETERELAEHIDELIEHYTKNGWIGIDAELRAVADMGEPESISNPLGRLHFGAGKPILFAIIAVILVSWFIEVIEEVYILGFNNGLIFLSEDIDKVWGFQTGSILSSINLNLLYLTLLVLAVFGFTKKKFLLIILSGTELFLLFDGLFWLIIAGGFPTEILPCVAVPAVLYTLTIILIRITDKEGKRLDETKEDVGLPLRICMSWGVSVLLVFYCVFASSAISGALDYTQAHREPLTIQNSMGDLPTEVCDEQIASTIDISDYDNLNFKASYWEYDEDYLYPQYMLPERFNTDKEAYWIFGDNTDFIYRLSIDDDPDYYDFAVQETWLLRKGYSFPSLSDGELSKITAADIDITDLLVGEDMQKARKVLVGIYNGEDYIIHDYKYTRRICWYFVGAEGLYLRRGEIVITKSGEGYITSDISYIHDKNGEEVIASNGPMFKLSDGASRELDNRLKHIG